MKPTLKNNSHLKFDDYLELKLEERKKQGLFRDLSFNPGHVDFSSNDYLGFTQSTQLRLEEKGELYTGASGSRLISGNSLLAEQTEEMIARFHGYEAALIFNCGYLANVGLFSCLASKGDTFITDEYIHASIIDGIKLSNANRFKFKHNSLEDLEKKLRNATGNKIIVVESIYSMDGNEAPLTAIVALCNKYNAQLIVDEAHATGVFGENGEGLVCKYHLQNDVYACIYTFGKAIGLHGAAITGSKTLRSYLINYARSFIYTTSLPPHTYLQLQKAYQLLPFADRGKLFDLISYFRKAIQKKDSFLCIDSHSPIQAILIGDNFKTRSLSKHLFDKRFYVKAVLSPTVPAGTERLRVCLHAFNTAEQIDTMLNEVRLFLK